MGPLEHAITFMQRCSLPPIMIDLFGKLYSATQWMPDPNSIGFITTGIAALVMMPVILYTTLSVIFSLAAVGPARKFMTTFFVVFLGVPLYPILAALLLTIVWFVLGVLAIALVTVGPVFLTALGWWKLVEWKNDFVADQRHRQARTDDINCLQLALGLLIGLLCLCTVGPCVFLLTLVKSPILVLSGLCQAWWSFAAFWYLYVGCPCCCPKRRSQRDQGDRGDASDSSEESSDDPNDYSFLWYWSPLVLVAWLIVNVLGVCVAILAALVSALVKLLASAIWPAYVAAGWLRSFGATGTRRRSGSCCTGVAQGFKAGYQVLWLSDIVTNIFIIGNVSMFGRFRDEFGQLVKGQREELSSECQKLSCLPPVVVGIFKDTWDLATRAIANGLEIGKDEADEAWRSLSRQMIRIGRHAIDDNVVTPEWIEGIPSELCIGLPARALLETIERSPNDGELVLASGLVLRSRSLGFGNEKFDKIWADLMEARSARAAAQLTDADRVLLCTVLLAGGGDPDALPDGLADAARAYDKMPSAARKQCQAILNPLVAVSIECSRVPAFRDKLMLVIEGITAEDGSPYMVDAEWQGSGESE